jgi:glyoxylase-like metal-dependent hydrolase (beta-lactamase superfamily II)
VVRVDLSDRHAWERPGAFEVAPGVHRIPLPLPGDALRAVNTYAIADGDGLVMIDGGWAMADATALLERSLGEIGYRLRDVREFLVTHVHRDHYTQAVAVRRLTGARVGLGDGEKASLDAIHAFTSYPEADRMRRAGAAEIAAQIERWDGDHDLSDWEYPDHWLDDGIDIDLDRRTLRVIATPGHTIGHVVFHDAGAGALFAGDHVLPHITPSIGVQLVRPESPLRDYLESLRLVLQLPDARLLPAHGPVTESTHERVEQLLHHHAERLDKTAAAVAAGASTGFEVAAGLGWTRRQRRLAELDLFNQMLAVSETVAHLDVLVERGWLTRTEVAGVVHYARA